MELTGEQKKVVEINSGRHLVLAPPGSGKTEMLSQRILRAVRAGVEPKRMLCATFTNRAAFEMRSRVEAEGGDLALPDVGNLHHFCHRFLCSVGRLPPTRHVLDEVEQRAFVREVVDVLRAELKSEEAADTRHTHGISLLRSIKGIVLDAAGTLNVPRVQYLHGLLEAHFAACAKADRSPYTDILAAVLIVHQRLIGIPYRYLRPMPPTMFALDGEGVIRAIAGAYAHLKRSFGSVDFDDLVNETYLYLEKTPLPEAKRFAWVQIDEVQDLSPLQWRIVAGLTAGGAASVYFGDVEQSIFSFLGASTRNFREETRDCERHFFKTNFRATPILLEILMRYSLDVLRSDWDFLPAPADVGRENGYVRAFGEGCDTASVYMMVKTLLMEKGTENVALLVRTNEQADAYESGVRALGYRYAKVSGVDLFAYAPMRDFLSLVAILIGVAGRTDWARLVRRFADGVFSAAQARYFVRGMFAVGFEPYDLWRMNDAIPRLPHPGDRRQLWAWRHRAQLASLRERLAPALTNGGELLRTNKPIRDIFALFSELALGAETRYSLLELWPEKGGPRGEGTSEDWEKARAHALERIETFLRYADKTFGSGEKPLFEQLATDWEKLRTLKEADLLVGDERVVISTIHKAKGRQFDAVIVPDVSDVVGKGAEEGDENARLLYVAMSRAKRHLVLLGAPNTPWFRRIAGCFEEGHVGYYSRKAAGAQLEDDMLCRWEQLAACHQAKLFDAGLVGAALALREGPLVRMALKDLRHDPDEADRGRRFRALLETGRLPGDCLAACIDGCTVCSQWDAETREAVRNAALGSTRVDVWDAALRYYEAVGTTDPRAAQACLADGLYFAESEVRRAAAEKLANLGEVRWLEVVRGSVRDFERLGKVAAPGHEVALRKMIAALEAAKVETAAKRLREVVFRRAMGGRSVY